MLNSLLCGSTFFLLIKDFRYTKQHFSKTKDKVPIESRSGSSVPVGHMVCANLDHITIARWLEGMFSNLQTAKEIVTDESEALLLASIYNN